MCDVALHDIKYDPRGLFLENSLNFNCWNNYYYQVLFTSPGDIQSRAELVSVFRALFWDTYFRHFLDVLSGVGGWVFLGHFFETLILDTFWVSCLVWAGGCFLRHLF